MSIISLVLGLVALAAIIYGVVLVAGGSLVVGLVLVAVGLVLLVVASGRTTLRL